MDAALASRLASDAPDDRAGAYAALEATEDVALAVACVVNHRARRGSPQKQNYGAVSPSK